MITITKNATYSLKIQDEIFILTAEEINDLHDKLTTFINDNYKELNPETD